MKILQILKNSHKILGQNARNQIFIKRPGSAKGRNTADDKLLTKLMLQENDIACPKLLGTIKNNKELKSFDWNILPKSFVMKPIRGSQGDGIEIFYNRDKDGNWIRGDGSKINLDEIKRMGQDIIDGRFSLNKEADRILFEERIRPHKELRNYTYRGTPDIRVVVFNSVPILAYVRFPTKESKGKANMIIGAVGTGVDLSTGITTSSVKGKDNGGRGTPIEFVAGTQLRYRGLRIPHWKKILELAIRCQQAIDLEFVAIDFLLDDEQGPVIVEINARPGLSIQLVNKTGLAWRLERVKGLKIKTIDQGIRIAQDLFGGEIEKTIERISGKELISNVMPAKIAYENKSISKLALIDTSRRTTTIDSEVAVALGIIDSESEDDEYVITDVEITLGAQKIHSTCKIVPKLENGYKVCIGRKDLGNFLIDIRKVDEREELELRKKVTELQPKTTIKKMDLIMNEISRHLSIVKMVEPINLSEEKKKFFESNFTYNPQFEYKPLNFDPDEYLNTLNSLNPSGTKIGRIYKEKISEIRKTIFLIESIGKGAETFTQRSISLFGSPSKKIRKIAKEVASEFTPAKILSSESEADKDYIREEIEKTLKKYKIVAKVIFSEKHGKASVGKVTGKIYINNNFRWTPRSVQSLIAHEIETHLLKKHNGSKQKYEIFSYGTAGYIKNEEGLATIMKRSKMKSQKMKVGAIKTIALSYGLTHNFIETFEKVNKYLKNPQRAWNIVYRIKRGLADTSQPGGLTKDQYFGWAIETAKEILEFGEPDLRYLFNGKGKIFELHEYTENQGKNYPSLSLDDIQNFLAKNHVDLPNKI